MAADLAVSSSRNVRHIAETWFSDRKHLVYLVHSLHSDARDPPAAGAAAAGGGGGAGAGAGGEGNRSRLIPQQTQCRHVDWYLNNVAASVMLTPNTSNPLHFGILRVSYSYDCVQFAELG